jgi:plasmid replication initiation protein
VVLLKSLMWNFIEFNRLIGDLNALLAQIGVILALFKSFIWAYLLKNQLTGIYMQEKIIVKKSSSLAVAHHNLSLIEQRFINMCIGRMYYGEIVDSTTKFLIKVDRYAVDFKITEKTALRQFNKIKEELPSKTIVIPEIDLEPISIVNSIEFRNSTIKNEVNVLFSIEILDHIANLTSNFIRYDLSNISMMQSSYSIRLYEIFKTRAYDKAKWQYSTNYDQLRSVLGISNSYTNNSGLNRLVKTSIEEINKLTDLDVSYKPNKQRRSFDGYCFELKEKAKDHK